MEKILDYKWEILDSNPEILDLKSIKLLKILLNKKITDQYNNIFSR